MNESKLNKTSLGLLALLITLIIITALGCFFQDEAGEIAYAANETTSTLYYLNGDWTFTWSSNGYSGDGSGTGKCTYGNTELLELRMFAEYQDGTGTMNKGDYINWETVNIYVRVIGTISSHVSFQLYKDGEIYKDNNLSGSASKVLLSESLPDGAYNFVYKFNYYVSSVLYKYTYTFNFHVDNSAPTGYFYDANSNVITGYAKGPFQYIVYGEYTSLQYKKDNGSWNTYLAGTLINEDGTYFFKVQDGIGNMSQTSIVKDTISPTIKFKDSSNKTISGYHNSSFYVVPEDSGSGLANTYYKYVAETSWTTLNPANILVNLDGTYNFKTVDRAGNESEIYTLIIDRDAPILSITVGATEYTSNSYISDNNGSIYIQDSNSGINEAYYTLNGERVEITNAVTQMTDEGVYNIYVKDNAGNESIVTNITVDYTAPTCTFISSKELQNGGYTNTPFKVSAQDNYSGVSYMGYYIYTDVDEYGLYYPEEFIPFNENTIFSDEGQYYFKLQDSLGNTNEYITVYMDLTPPELILFNDYGEITSGDTVNTNVYAYDVHEENNAYYVYTKSGDMDYTRVTGYWENHNGWHYWYAEDEAGNRSEIISYYLDTTPPELSLYYKGEAISSGYLLNDITSLSYTALDAYTDIEGIYYSLDNYNYSSFSSFRDLQDTRDGEITFKVMDMAGNYSQETYIILDTTPPTITAITSNVYSVVEKFTSAEGIYIRATDKYNCRSAYIRTSEGVEPQIYTFGQVISLEGKYIVSVVDNAGNVAEKTYYIDRTVQTPVFHNVSNNTTNGDVYITWENLDEDAPLELVTVNGIEYTNGEVIYTIYNGQYSVYFRDICSNEGYYTFTSSKKNILTETVNKLRYETYGYSFETYAHALDYGTILEEEFVEVNTWIGPDWDEGIQMDYVDSINAKAGTYYLYKSADNPNIRVAYFTVSRIIEVMQAYAAKNIEEKWYWDINIAPAYEGENIYSFANSGTVMANEIELNTGIVYIDGELYEGNTYSTPGTHNVVIQDGYTNTFNCTFVISERAPEIGYSVNDNFYLSITRDTYYLTGNIYLTLLDYIDADSVLIITKDNVKNIIGIRDKFLLTNGKYEVYAINRCHIGESKTIYVSNNPAQISVTENTSKKRLDISITKSQDLAAGITNIFIYKKTGEDYVLLTQDDFAGTISSTRYTYSFATSGEYKIVVEDKYRSGLDAVTSLYTYTQPQPQANIYGVQENGYTNKDVNIQYSDYVTCSLYKDNVYVKNLSSRERITEEGTYLALIQDLDGNEIRYNFVIDKTAPVITIQGCEREGTTNSPVTLTWNEGLGYIVLGDTITRIDSGTTFTEDNKYHVVVEDEAGNISQFGFNIDTKVSYTINVLNGAISNSDVIVHSSEDVDIEMRFNGALMKYAPEEVVSEEGEYTLTIRDSFGNEETMNFRIIKHTQKSFNYTPGEGVTIDNVLSSGQEVEHGDSLNLTKDGIYSITIWDGEVYYTFNICIDTTPPEVTLEGVENGGTTKNKVKVTSVSEDCTIIAKKDGVEFKYAVGESLEELGNYELLFVDSVGNSTSVTFSIVYKLNGAAIALIVLSCLVLVGGAIALVIYRFKKFGKKKKTEEIEIPQEENKEVEEIELD